MLVFSNSNVFIAYTGL